MNVQETFLQYHLQIDKPMKDITIYEVHRSTIYFAEYLKRKLSDF